MVGKSKTDKWELHSFCEGRIQGLEYNSDFDAIKKNLDEHTMKTFTSYELNQRHD